MSDVNQNLQQVLSNLTQDVPLCSDVALFKIDHQGHWRYLNSPLPPKFSRLFSSILYRVDGEYYLITPVEKLIVHVDTVALVIVDYEMTEDNNLAVKTSIGTEHTVEGTHKFSITDDGIFIELERNLEAELGRACYYRFVDEFVVEH